MRLIGIALLGFVVGFGAGIIISEIIGITGFLMFQRATGIRYLSLILGVAFAVAAPAVDRRIRRRGLGGPRRQ